MTQYNFIQELKVGYLTPKLKIEVRTNDPGDLPHFHIVDSNTNGKLFHTCIEIAKNNYFRHEGKMGILTDSKTRKELQFFMLSKPKLNHKYIHLEKFIKTNWLYICLLWNENNSKKKINPTKTIMPNYTTINLER